MNVAMMARRALLVLLAVGMAACSVGSVSPVLSDEDIQFDSQLVGTWQDSEGKETAVITPVEPSGYFIKYTDSEGTVSNYRGSLGRVKTLRILDLEPDYSCFKACDSELLVPLHLALLVDSLGQELHVRVAEYNALKEYLEQHPNALANVVRDDIVIVTASTEDIQKFLVKYVRREGALGETSVWTRRSH